MKKIFKKNYKAVKNRGLINEKTTDYDFWEKLKEEIEEVRTASNEVNQMYELADVITVCANWILHYNHRPEFWLKKVLKNNKKRAKT